MADVPLRDSKYAQNQNSPIFWGSKSGDNTAAFSQKNPKLKTPGSHPNPGVLRGFLERESGNRSPIRAFFPGTDIPVRAQNKAGSGGIRRDPKGKREKRSGCGGYSGPLRFIEIRTGAHYGNNLYGSDLHNRMPVLVPAPDTFVNKSLGNKRIRIDHVPPINNHRPGSSA